MTYLMHVVKRVHDDQIDFIFDTLGGESKTLLIREYERFKSLAPLEFQQIAPKIPRFECEQEFKPLQAADMIAWLARRHFFDQARGHDPVEGPSNVLLANLFKPDHDILDFWDDPRIKGAADTISQSSWLKGQRFKSGIKMTLPDPTSLLKW
jgi:hypothetical protein